jgi:hypothetical protein
MGLILKRLVALVGRIVLVFILFRYASTYFVGRKAAGKMTLAPVIALSHGGGEIDTHSL